MDEINRGFFANTEKLGEIYQKSEKTELDER